MKMEEVKRFSKKLKELRLIEGMTQEEFALRVKVSRCHISEYESGKRIPDEKTIFAISSAFDIPKQYFTEEELIPVPFADQRIYEADITKFLSNGMLDISSISAKNRIHLQAFYYMLKGMK